MVEERTGFAQETISEQNGTGNSRPNWKIGRGDEVKNTPVGFEEKAVVCEELKDNDNEILQLPESREVVYKGKYLHEEIKPPL